MPSMSPEHQKPRAPKDELDDPLWQLLGNASNKKPSAFFARNVVRESRLQAPSSLPLSDRFKNLFRNRPIKIALCLSLIMISGFLTWPIIDSTSPSLTKARTTNAAGDSSTTATLNELIIEESLNAAADDPSIYTRDEIVAMIGF
jgi:hypothetical protein